MDEKRINLWSDIKKYKFAYVLIFPTLLYLTIFLVYPILESIRLSFTDLSFLNPKSGGFIGLENYKNLFLADAHFWKIISNTFLWVLGSTVLQYLFAIPIATLLNQKLRLRGLWRGLVMVPWVTPTVIMGLIWKWIFDGDFGLLNYLLGTDIVWLGNELTVWPSLLLASFWKGLPYATLMLLAGLQSIPVDIYEAAYVDGCGAFKRFAYVTIPLLKPIMFVTVLTSIVQSWTKFELIWVLTAGGPGYTTSVLPTYIYTQSFSFFNMGMGSAISVVSMLIMILFIIAYLKVYRRNLEEE